MDLFGKQHEYLCLQCIGSSCIEYVSGIIASVPVNAYIDYNYYICTITSFLKVETTSLVSILNSFWLIPKYKCRQTSRVIGGGFQHYWTFLRTMLLPLIQHPFFSPDSFINQIC